MEIGRHAGKELLQLSRWRMMTWAETCLDIRQMTEMITEICWYSLWSKRKNKRCLLNSPAWKTWMGRSTISWELFRLPSSERILCTITITSYKNEIGNYLNTKKDKRFILELWVLSLIIPYTEQQYSSSFS